MDPNPLHEDVDPDDVDTDYEWVPIIYMDSDSEDESGGDPATPWVAHPPEPPPGHGGDSPGGDSP